MKHRFKLGRLGVGISMLTILSAGSAVAGGDHDAPHAESDKHSAKTSDHRDERKSHDMDEGHAHASWEAVPAEYTNYRNANWEDRASAQRGMVLFAQLCVQCHGLGGTGDGVVAKSLEHKPANLSKHFHVEDGSSDAYLFWRVSEGGTVEPFKSSNSTMPAFKYSLNEQQRWDVLTYIHQQIHEGFSLSKGDKKPHSIDAKMHQHDSHG
jgi:mono/diheme cytochrome c family protein